MSGNKNNSWFDRLTELFGWVQIMLSPTLVGLMLGGLYYLYSPNLTGKIAGISAGVIGLIIGIIWATKVKKKYGTIWFISRNMATPELDAKNNSEKDRTSDSHHQGT